MDLGNGLGHLTYSTLVHPADNWEQLWNSLNTYLPKVKARIAGNKSFGVCIRLSASTAQTLANAPAERDKLKKFLTDHDMYIYTANAFVYGHFKGEKVKEEVYEPDWRTEERTQYTINVANVLADVCPAGIAPSIQSAPLGFKPRVTGSDVVSSYTDNVLRVVAHLMALETKTASAREEPPAGKPLDPASTTGKLVQLFQSQLIIGAALLEGAAFFAGIAYMLERSPLALATAIVLLIALAARFPTSGRVHAWFDRQRELIEEDRLSTI